MRRHSRAMLTASIGSVLLLAASTVSAQTVGAVHTFHEIGDGVVVAVPRYGGGNSTLIIGSDHVIVVDAQGSHAAAVALIDEIRRLTPFPVRFVIDTHWHGDHHGGNAAFREAFPDVRIIAHSETAEGIAVQANQEIRGVAPFLREEVRAAERDLAQGSQDGAALSGQQREQLDEFVRAEVDFLDDIPDDFRYELPDQFVDDRLILPVSGRRVVVEHPGRAHTEGDLWVYLPEEGVLIAGDLVTVPYIVPRSGFPRSYAGVLRDISELAPTVVVPGHGRPAGHQELISRMAEFLDVVASLAEASLRDGVDLDVAVEAALRSDSVARFESQIDWTVEGGLTFLDFSSLVQMTIGRAYEEAGSVESNP